MAQEVSYFEDNVTFSEGPFVLCNALGNGYRVEAEIKGAKCPALPDLTVHNIMTNELAWMGKTLDREAAARVVDLLNDMVRRGRIVLHKNGFWYDSQRAEEVRRTAG